MGSTAYYNASACKCQELLCRTSKITDSTLSLCHTYTHTHAPVHCCSYPLCRCHHQQCRHCFTVGTTLATEQTQQGLCLLVSLLPFPYNACTISLSIQFVFISSQNGHAQLQKFMAPRLPLAPKLLYFKNLIFCERLFSSCFLIMVCLFVCVNCQPRILVTQYLLKCRTGL